MYAVIKTGGKQYRVTQGQVLTVEKLADTQPGDEIQFNEVLMVANEAAIKIGQPALEGASVKAEVVEHGRADKIHILKFKRRKHHMKQQGHRQHFTQVKIVSIEQ